MAILVEDNRPLVKETVEFQYPDSIDLLALLGVFGLSGFWCREKRQKLTEMFGKIWWFPIENLIDEISPVVLG